MKMETRMSFKSWDKAGFDGPMDCVEWARWAVSGGWSVWLGRVCGLWAAEVEGW